MIGNIIKKAREQKGISVNELGRLAGISAGYVSEIERNKKTNLSMETLEKLSKALEVPISKLVENKINKYQQSLENSIEIIAEDIEDYFSSINNLNSSKGLIVYHIPLYGSISAGKPLEANNNIECFIPTDKRFISETREYFYLTIKGDSMDKEFQNGNLVLVQKQNFLANGEIGVILIDGLDATVKKVVIDGDLITLIPCSNNPDHFPKTYNMRQENINILGKVVLAMKNYL